MSTTIKFLISTAIFAGVSTGFAPPSNAQETSDWKIKTAATKQPAIPAATNEHPDGHRHAEKKEASVAEKYFTDVSLVDQHGRSLRFYNDVLKGKVVVINAMFTSCTNVCPLMNKNFEKIQEAFGDRIGKDVFLVSISVDPTVDTPERLEGYARRFKAKPGWLFLTGKKENVDWALYKLGQYAEKPDDHKTIILIGNEATGVWKKALGLAQASELIKLVEEVIVAK